MKTCLTAAACLLAASCLFAQETNAVSIVTLDPIIVTASRLDKTPQEMPDYVRVVTADEIRRSGVQDTTQAVERLGQIYLRNALGSPSEASVSMRGLGDNAHTRVLVLVNGRRLNNPDMKAPNLLSVPLASISRIEVIRGNQTVLHGGVAAAGVINIVTAPPTAESANQVEFSAGSDRTFRFGGSFSGPLSDSTAYALNLGWLRSDGWRKNSDYEVWNARADIFHAPSERFDITLGADYVNTFYRMPGALTLAQFRQDPEQSDPAKRYDRYRSETWGTDGLMTGRFRNDAELSLNWRISRRDSSYDFNNGFDTIAIERTDQTLDTFLLSPRLDLPFTVAGFRNQLTFGVDFAYEKVNTAKYRVPSGARLTEGKLDNISVAAYIRNELFITETLSLAAGFRAERQRLDGPVWADTYLGKVVGDRVADHHGFSYDASLLWRPTETLKLYLKGGMLYHYPTMDEQAFYTGYTPVGINPDLDPEWGTSFEAGFSWTPSEEWELAATFYRNEIRDGITYNSLTMMNDNLEKTETYGVEAAITWQRRDVGLLRASCEYAHPRFNEGANDGKTVPLVPAFIGSVYGELELPAGFTLLAAFRGVTSQYYSGDNANQAERLSSYATLDLGLRYTPVFMPDLSIHLGVDNVFDKTYATYGYWYNYNDDFYSLYPANGRTFRLGVSYTF